MMFLSTLVNEGKGRLFKSRLLVSDLPPANRLRHTPPHKSQKILVALCFSDGPKLLRPFSTNSTGYCAHKELRVFEIFG